MTTATDPRPSANLPLPLTGLVGRERETAELRALLDPGGDGPRLLTLTGVGGAGKTRLALDTAAALSEAYPAGAWFVELAPLADPALVPQAVAAALGVREHPARPLLDQLLDHLRPQMALLVLDNCEHLIDACAQLAEMLLIACPEVRLLATSREALRVPGEAVWPVPPLAAPDPARLPPVERLLEYAAVRLFVERGRSQRADFALGEGNARAVVEICRRLDGIPLALELAAARLRALPPGELAARLGDALRLLGGGSRTAPARQQTLRAALDWSYDLLAPEEQALFRRLAVFAGGWTLEAAEAVCAATSDERRATSGDLHGDDSLAGDHSSLVARRSSLDVLEGLARLVDQSLVVVEAATVAGEEAVRYRLLEPVRQYAAAQLAREPRPEGTRQGEGGSVRERHAAYYLALAERAGPELHRADQPAWLERLEQEVDNLRAALAWVDEQGGQARAEMGLRFGYALWPFWWLRGYLSEGRGWLEDFLRAEGAQARTLLRARALFAAGRLALLAGDYPGARAWLEESLAITRELGHDGATAGALTQLGHVALQEGDYARARARYQGGLAIRQARGDKRDLAISYTSLGHVALAAGDHAGARRWLEDALAFYQEARDEAEMARAQWLLGDVALAEGDVAEACGHYSESLARCRRLGHRQGLAYSLEGFALLAAASARAAGTGSPGHRSGLERAVRLLGAVAALAEQVAVPPLPARRGRLQRLHEEARGGLGEEAYAAAWQAGRAQLLEEATAAALHAADEAPPATPATGAIRAELTPREVDVLRLIAAGRSNQEIARSLNLSVRTVERHIGNLYGKLGARGRADAVAAALRYGLDPAEGLGRG